MSPITSFISHPLIAPSPRLDRSSSSRRAPLCELDPSSPTESSPNLSATDRQYLAKIKKKFLNARRTAQAARSDYEGAFGEDGKSSSRDDDVLPADMPDDLDAMEDMLYDRAPVNAGQVKMFGAWLDEGLAGRKAGDKAALQGKEGVKAESEEEEELKQQKADASFRGAMAQFGKGGYEDAVRGYMQAIMLVGAPTRTGGQYGLWLAQALDAAGRKREATDVLRRLESHDDREVRKVARELLFIITAPRLQLDRGNFMEIPNFEESGSAVTEKLLMSNFGPLQTALVEKQPEPYTLEWYMKKERPPKRSEEGGEAQVMVLMAAVVGTLAFMFSSGR